MSSSSNTVSEDEDCNNYSQIDEQEDESEVENYDEPSEEFQILLKSVTRAEV